MCYLPHLCSPLMAGSLGEDHRIYIYIYTSVLGYLRKRVSGYLFVFPQLYPKHFMLIFVCHHCCVIGLVNCDIINCHISDARWLCVVSKSVTIAPCHYW